MKNAITTAAVISRNSDGHRNDTLNQRKHSKSIYEPSPFPKQNERAANMARAYAKWQKSVAEFWPAASERSIIFPQACSKMARTWCTSQPLISYRVLTKLPTDGRAHQGADACKIHQTARGRRQRTICSTPTQCAGIGRPTTELDDRRARENML